MYARCRRLSVTKTTFHSDLLLLYIYPPGLHLGFSHHQPSLPIFTMTFFTTIFKKTPQVSPLTRFQVDLLLEKAEKAEIGEFSSSYVSAGADTPQYPHLNAHEERDGVWVCCCKHENPLQHFKGAFPFKRLVCGSCSHVLCSDCETTAIIAPLHEQTTLIEKGWTELRLFQVCPSCGLSHRAENRMPDQHGNRLCWVPEVSHSHVETCSCGEPARSNWSKYAIGEAYGFRLEPVKTTHKCRMKLLNRQIEQQVTAASLPQEQHLDGLLEVPGSRYEEFPYTVRRKPVPLRVVNAPPNASPLGRSGAVRGGRPSRLPRFTTFDVPPGACRPEFIARAGTWATADEHRRAYEEA